MQENKKDDILYADFIKLVKQAQKGNQKSEEKIFEILIDEIRKIAKRYMKKYYYVSNDESEYQYFVVVATKAAIDNFNEDKGDFYHYWRKCISSQKKKFLDKTYKNKQVNLQDSAFDYFLYDNSKELTFADSSPCLEELEEDNLKKYYLKELSQKVMNIASSFSKNDESILELYSLSYSFIEISKILNMTTNQVISRFYYLIKIIQQRVNIEEYI